MGLLQSLLGVLSDEDPFSEIHQDLSVMLSTGASMVEASHREVWDGTVAEDLYEQDVKVNKAERGIRRAIAVQAVVDGGPATTHSLLLMNLVKDAERVGDQAKNIHETVSLPGAMVPGKDTLGDVAQEVRQLGDDAVAFLQDTLPVLDKGDTEAAKLLTERGMAIKTRCRDQLHRVAAEIPAPGQAVQLALLCRFYKRVAAHCQNMLSTLIMPLHKIDYFDAKSLEK